MNITDKEINEAYGFDKLTPIELAVGEVWDYVTTTERFHLHSYLEQALMADRPDWQAQGEKFVWKYVNRARKRMKRDLKAGNHD